MEATDVTLYAERVGPPAGGILFIAFCEATLRGDERSFVVPCADNPDLSVNRHFPPGEDPLSRTYSFRVLFLLLKKIQFFRIAATLRADLCNILASLRVTF